MVNDLIKDEPIYKDDFELSGYSGTGKVTSRDLTKYTTLDQINWVSTKKNSLFLYDSRVLKMTDFTNFSATSNPTQSQFLLYYISKAFPSKPANSNFAGNTAFPVCPLLAMVRTFWSASEVWGGTAVGDEGGIDFRMVFTTLSGLLYGFDLEVLFKMGESKVPKGTEVSYALLGGSRDHIISIIGANDAGTPATLSLTISGSTLTQVTFVNPRSVTPKTNYYTNNALTNKDKIMPNSVDYSLSAQSDKPAMLTALTDFLTLYITELGLTGKGTVTPGAQIPAEYFSNFSYPLNLLRYSNS
jgi:hypothetical protein